MTTNIKYKHFGYNKKVSSIAVLSIIATFAPISFETIIGLTEKPWSWTIGTKVYFDSDDYKVLHCCSSITERITFQLEQWS